MRAAPLAAVVFLSALLAGCSSTTFVSPPANPADPVPVFLADYGRHASLVLPYPDGGLVEYAYGDWNFFALAHTRWPDAIEALFFSRGATLAWRRIPTTPDDPGLQQKLQADHLLRLTVPRDLAQSLVRRLDARIDSQLETMIYNIPYQLFFVRDDDPYSLGHNCNHVTAQWLRDLGCTIRGRASTSDFRLEPPPQP